MNVPKSIFRQYDVRGLVDRELTPDFARALGRAFASVAGSVWAEPPSSRSAATTGLRAQALSAGVRRGIAEAGGTAIDVGTLPTPALYFGVSALKTDGGLQVTGSHNPPEFNGFKMVLGRRCLSRRRHPGAVGDHHGRALAVGQGQGDLRRLGASALSRGDHQPAPAGASGACRGRLRQRRRQPGRRLNARRGSAPR